MTSDTSTASWQKRHALHLARQLPENLEDALFVLQYAREIVERLYADGRAPKAQPVVAFIRKEGA